MRLPIRNYLPAPMTVFVEPICDQYEVPAGGEAIITLEDGHPHSIDLHPNNWVSVWNEGFEPAVVEVFGQHQFAVPKKNPES